MRGESLYSINIQFVELHSDRGGWLMRAVALALGVGLIASALVGSKHAGQAAETPARVIVSAGSQTATAGIQEAIDSLPSLGGVVAISPGEFLLRRSIRIRNGITLQGAGEKTVLCRDKQVGTS
jgi:hypothetical protein